MKTTVTEVAVEFTRIMLSSTAPAVMRIVRERNREFIAEGLYDCATHDYCDANIVMMHAFLNLDLPDPSEDEALIPLWNAAWDLARKCDFNIDTIKEHVE